MTLVTSSLVSSSHPPPGRDDSPSHDTYCHRFHSVIAEALPRGSGGSQTHSIFVRSTVGFVLRNTSTENTARFFCLLEYHVKVQTPLAERKAILPYFQSLILPALAAGGTTFDSVRSRWQDRPTIVDVTIQLAEANQ